MSLFAFLTFAVVIGIWAGIRVADASRRVHDLTTYVLSIPADEWESR